MDAKVDFCNDIKQKNLIARSGRSRYSIKSRELTQKEMVAMNGPVKTWPNLPGFWDRCEFLRASEGLSVKEFSAEIKGIIGSLSDDKEYRAQVVISK